MEDAAPDPRIRSSCGYAASKSEGAYDLFGVACGFVWLCIFDMHVERFI